MLFLESKNSEGTVMLSVESTVTSCFGTASRQYQRHLTADVLKSLLAHLSVCLISKRMVGESRCPSPLRVVVTLNYNHKHLYFEQSNDMIVIYFT